MTNPLYAPPRPVEYGGARAGMLFTIKTDIDRDHERYCRFCLGLVVGRREFMNIEFDDDRDEFVEPGGWRLSHD